MNERRLWWGALGIAAFAMMVAVRGPATAGEPQTGSHGNLAAGTRHKTHDAPPKSGDNGSGEAVALQAPQLQQVTVTARKRSENLLSVPESVSAITSADLTRKGIEDVEDIGHQTTNLQINTRQDLTTDVVIRGVGAYGDVLGVGFNIDDVPNYTDQTMPIEDVERVEILKGPQGTLYGSSSIGGLIRYITKKPAFDWDGETSVSYGSYNDIDSFAAQDLSLIDGKLAMRASGYEHQGSGYLTNGALGINGDPLKQYGVRTMLLWNMSDSVNALLTFRHEFMRNGADEYSPVPGVKSFTYDAPFFQANFNRRSIYGVVLELNADLPSSLRLTSVSSYTRAAYEQNVDISFTPPGVPGQTLFTLPGNRPTEVTTQELRVTSPSGGSFDWLVGLYGAVIRNILLNQNAVGNYPPPVDQTVVNDFQTKRRDTSVYGTTDYRIDGFTLETGVRLTETRSFADVFVEAGGLPDQAGEITSRAVLPKVSLSYALARGGLIYATVAKGQEPGAVNTVSVAPIPFKAQTAISREVGIKGVTANRRAEYDLAAFYVTDDNHQVQTNQYIAAEGGLVTLTANIGNSRTYGVEASGSWLATDDLTLGIGAGYLNAKWKEGEVFGMPIDGNSIPNAPEVSGTLSAKYSRAVPGGFRVEGNVDMSYTDAMWWDLPNTPGSEEAPYWIGNARLGFGSADGTWEVAFRVSNLLGAKYWTEYFPNFFPAGGYPCAGCSDIGAIGAPREYFGSITFNY